MKKRFIRSLSILVIIVFAASFAACGHPSDEKAGLNNAEAGQEQREVGVQQEAAVQQGNDAGDKGSGSNTIEGSAAAKEMAQMLSNPKLPMNYTFELYREDPRLKGDNHYPRVTRKDNKLKIEYINTDGEDKGKVAAVEYFDFSTCLVQGYNVKSNNVVEYTDNAPIEYWGAYDPSMYFKNIAADATDPDSSPYINKIREETIDGHPCVVFELKPPDTQDNVINYYISKEYNIIINFYQNYQGTKMITNYRNLKTGQVTDAMVMPDFPKDATVTKR